AMGFAKIRDSPPVAGQRNRHRAAVRLGFLPPSMGVAVVPFFPDQKTNNNKCLSIVLRGGISYRLVFSDI
ncbi:hypothetical protein, partial [Klebsiella quasipneumoniae]|uniref:hypothetical protein n=1 Tax=Klebsiella quasipneumoniae TaxID=1463165 RepID=UPI0022300DF8